MSKSNPTLSSLTWPLAAGLAISLAFFAGFGGWAALAPLAGAAVAPGKVIPEGRRRTVQHLEGGIVREILVREGSLVAAGDPVIRLDDTAASSAYMTALGAWQTQKATEARLLAEQRGSADIPFPEALTTAAGSDPTIAQLLADEAARLRTNREALAGRKAILESRIAQSKEEIAGHRSVIASAETQSSLIRDEMSGVKALLDKGLERKPRYLALQRTAAQIESVKGSTTAQIARAKQVIAESRMQIANLEQSRADQAAQELGKTRAALMTLEEQLRSTRDRLTRTLIAAPVSGTVVELKARTVGGVIGEGEPLMDIVPADDRLVIEARVAPTDIDEVHSGLEAQLHLLAYKSRTLPRIEGRVVEVSADRLSDPETGIDYYAARVEVERSALPEGVELASGMPAEVMIVTGRRTLLDYLLQPARDVLRRGLRES